MSKPRKAFRSDWYCTKCVRALHNQHPNHKGLADTVKWLGEDVDAFTHQGCGGIVKSAKEAGVAR